ncbi:hypothetical protein LTR50_000365 [Elasticomyces elasticus]|nr:hypothetical protein LTR50_000365 [Elasticomyces elasticus]
MAPSSHATTTSGTSPLLSPTEVPAFNSTPQNSSSLTPAQAVGVSVAAMGSMMLIVAGIFLIACLRRRRVVQPMDEKQSYDYIDVAPPRFSPFHYGVSDPRGPLGGFSKQRVELAGNGKSWSWARPIDAARESAHLKQRSELAENARTWSWVRPTTTAQAATVTGLALSPELKRPVSANSATSMRTVSQLLPEKPSNSPTSSPQLVKPTKIERSASAATGITLFEEDRSSQSLSTQMNLPLPPIPVHASIAQEYLNPKTVNTLTSLPDKTRRPALSLGIPVNASTYQKPPSPTNIINIPIPAIPRESSPLSWQQMPSTAKMNSTHPSLPPHSAARSTASYLPAYYTSSESQTPTGTAHSSVQLPPDVFIYTTSISPLNRTRRESCASETSFESVDLDEPTPPEENKQLTPVVESPISGLRYPKVPRSSNQAVPRSPQASLSPQQVMRVPRTPERQNSCSTLAAKRRGNDAAQDLERRFHITNSAFSNPGIDSRPTTQGSLPKCPQPVHNRDSQTSPLKGYGGTRPLLRTPDRTGNPSRPEMALKSPLWEPKLTPSRRGEDLYLSVTLG